MTRPQVRPGLSGWMWLALLLLTGQVVYFFAEVVSTCREAQGAEWADIWASKEWLFIAGYNLASRGALAVYAVILTVAFLRRRRWVPRHMTYFFACAFILRNVLVPVIGVMMNSSGYAQMGTARLMFSSVFSVAVVSLWIRYFSKNDDVKKTFVT
ncbi:DUF2569 family protein [Myxococcaceae bacterium JPH2]|nr:DUF2569 family protein [Myxococcaceae bacterium JPH2]